MQSTLSAKQIGYLRKAPLPGSDPIDAPSAAIKGMWRKLAATGHVEEIPPKKTPLYIRTDKGQAAVETYDRNLSDEVIAVLRTLRSAQDSMRVAMMRGIMTALDAGLVEFRDDPKIHYVLTADGEAAVARRF